MPLAVRSSEGLGGARHGAHAIDAAETGQRRRCLLGEMTAIAALAHRPEETHDGTLGSRH
jgi:hypothetical protein